MKSWLFFAGVAACAFACGCCRKQEGAACQPSAGEKPGAEQQMAVATDDAFAAVDKNADGKLSKDEYFAIWKTADVAERNFKTLDKNGDGEVTRDEFPSVTPR